MKWSLNLGKIAGIRLSVHWTFIILIIWIFIMHYNMGNGMMPALMGVVFILALFVCVTLHELGHAITAGRFNIVTKSITLLPIGGLAQMERMPEKPVQELLVAIAGPLVNVAIAILLFIYLQLSDGIQLPLQMEQLQDLSGSGFWLNLFFANMVLAVFNLVPAFPMDGGRILRALLAFRFDRGKATKIAAGIGQMLAIAFVFLGFFSNIWLIFIGVFIYLGAEAEASFEVTKSALKPHTVRDVLMKNYSPVSPDESLQKVVNLLLDGQEQEFVVVENQVVTGVLTRKDLIKGLSEKGKNVPVSEVMQKDFLSLAPEEPLAEVFQQMILKNISVAPVIENGNMIGIVNRENIDELIMVKSALMKDTSTT